MESIGSYFEAVIKMAGMLNEGKYTAKEIARRLNLSVRTVHRYLLLLEDLGWNLEKDFSNKYFMVGCKCPVCNNEIKDNG
jgi:DNA-binding IclR family transcriptional regulator